jgi:hypothetical protein
MDYVRREVEEHSLVEESIDPDGMEGFGHVTKTGPVSPFKPKFLVILSTKWASCNDVLHLDLNPNCSSRISPRSFTTCKIIAIRIFSNNLPIVSKRLLGQ